MAANYLLEQAVEFPLLLAGQPGVGIPRKIGLHLGHRLFENLLLVPEIEIEPAQQHKPQADPCPHHQGCRLGPPPGCGRRSDHRKQHNRPGHGPE